MPRFNSLQLVLTGFTSRVDYIVDGLIRVSMFTSHREDVLLTSWAIGKAHLAGTEQTVTSWTNPTYLKCIHMVVEFDYTLW